MKMSVSLVKDRKGNEMDVQIYTTPTCGYCLQAKNWFNEHGIEYVEHTMTTEAELSLIHISEPTRQP